MNQCGRTELKGNIDVGENTENALAANAVTQVKAGSEVTVTIHQVNADGAGPFVCDLDETSNSGTNLQASSTALRTNVVGADPVSSLPESHRDQQRTREQWPVAGQGAGFQRHCSNAQQLAVHGWYVLNAVQMVEKFN